MCYRLLCYRFLRYNLLCFKSLCYRLLRYNFKSLCCRLGRATIADSGGSEGASQNRPLHGRAQAAQDEPRVAQGLLRGLLRAAHSGLFTFARSPKRA